MRKRTIKIMVITAIIMIAISAVIVILLAISMKSTNNMADLKKYYKLEEGSAGKAAIVFMDRVETNSKVLIEDDEKYIGTNALKEITDRFYVDENEDKIIFTTPTNIIEIKADEKGYTLDGAEQTYEKKVELKKGDYRYIALSFVEKFCDVEVEFVENPNRVILRYGFGEKEKRINVEKNGEIRIDPSDRSNILAKVKAGTSLKVIESDMAYYRPNYKKVMTDDGLVGYIEKDKLSKDIEEVEIARKTSKEDPSKVYKTKQLDNNEKVSLAWLPISDDIQNEKFDQKISDVKGVNVIAPTWLGLDTNGDTFKRGAKSVVESAHNKDMKVWATFQSTRAESKFNEVVVDTKKRQKIEDDIIDYVEDYGADGVNVDVETITVKEKDSYMQFLRELSVKCRNKGLTLSVDNYVPIPSNSYYQLDKQSEFVDYVIIMAYDKNVGKDPVQIEPSSDNQWIQTAISRSKEMNVDSKKLVIALPFFWNINFYKSSVEIEFDKVAMSMKGFSRQKLLPTESVMASKKMDEAKGMNYVKYAIDDGTTCEAWIEDAESIGNKLNVLEINKDKVAGVGFWSLGQENADVWDKVEAYMSK